MKVVINKCFGGFGLSPLAIKEYAKLIGKECYFFKGGLREPYTSIDLEEATKEGLFNTAFSIPNPNEVLIRDEGGLNLTKESDKLYSQISLWSRDIERTDLNLIKVIESLGSEKASGRFAKLKIVEIPDGVDYQIDEYDGLETIHEKHREWG